MTYSNTHLLACTSSEIMDWLNGTGALSALPEAKVSTCLWLTLGNDGVVNSHTVQEKRGPAVAILDQGGLHTAPEDIWPTLQRYTQMVAYEGEPMWLVLTGNQAQQQKIAWQHYLSFTTPCRPPLKRLIAFGIAAAFMRGFPLRLWHLLRRLTGRQR